MLNTEVYNQIIRLYTFLDNLDYQNEYTGVMLVTVSNSKYLRIVLECIN